MCASRSSHEAVSPLQSNRSEENLSIRNRILSIHLDSEYVKSVTNQISGAVVANERCGSWYVPPETRTGAAYFKSTDGHTGCWSFNTRRLNLGLLNILGQHGKCFLVDSARRKAMPDALSKTVPIWATVMNRLLFPERGDSYKLYTDVRHVPLAEHAQIEGCLDNFLRAAKGLPLDTESLQQAVRFPIKVHFCSHRDGVESLPRLDSERSVHLICLSASLIGDETSTLGDGFHYVPGAGDDAEHWARGLTPGLLWEHMSGLLPCSADNETERAADAIVTRSETKVHDSFAQPGHLKPIYITPSASPFYIGGYYAVEEARIGNVHVDAVIICREIKDWPSDTSNDPNTTAEAVNFISIAKPVARRLPVLNLHCPARKLGSRALRTEFRHIDSFLQTFLQSNSKPRLLFACDVGIDLAIGVALATTCLHVDENGQFRLRGKQLRPDKESEGKNFVRRRLVQILQQTGLDDVGSGHDRGIQRTTLTAVNSIVIERPRRCTQHST